MTDVTDGTGGVTVVPNPPVAGQEVTVSVQNDAQEISWRIPPDGEEHRVPLEDGKARFPVPAGAAGREIAIVAGEPPDIVSDEFEVISTSNRS